MNGYELTVLVKFSDDEVGESIIDDFGGCVGTNPFVFESTFSNDKECKDFVLQFSNKWCNDLKANFADMLINTYGVDIVGVDYSISNGASVLDADEIFI